MLFRDPTNAGRRFIPLLLADCDLPDTLRRYKYVDLREDRDAAFEELLTACRVLRRKKLLWPRSQRLLRRPGRSPSRAGHQYRPSPWRYWSARSPHTWAGPAAWRSARTGNGRYRAQVKVTTPASRFGTLSQVNAGQHSRPIRTPQSRSQLGPTENEYSLLRGTFRSVSGMQFPAVRFSGGADSVCLLHVLLELRATSRCTICVRTGSTTWASFPPSDARIGLAAG